jgi:hypothetical protein
VGRKELRAAYRAFFGPTWFEDAKVKACYKAGHPPSQCARAASPRPSRPKPKSKPKPKPRAGPTPLPVPSRKHTRKEADEWAARIRRRAQQPAATGEVDFPEGYPSRKPKPRPRNKRGASPVEWDRIETYGQFSMACKRSDPRVDTWMCRGYRTKFSPEAFFTMGDYEPVREEVLRRARKAGWRG